MKKNQNKKSGIVMVMVCLVAMAFSSASFAAFPTSVNNQITDSVTQTFNGGDKVGARSAVDVLTERQAQHLQYHDKMDQLAARSAVDVLSRHAPTDIISPNHPVQGFFHM
ncbi:MAG: hypothetical protein EP326_14300 [Deltaproteobacteria bacterium]|nr:MAG: hypothetical protein EP326_14300 [Deltaproteobacteria bacterium]TNF31621.1 MAG: hypothetical protein EP319_01615 [Deltaproteobacteria bacterium]